MWARRLPATCDLACAEVLVPMRATCDGFLRSLKDEEGIQLVQTLDAVVKTCPDKDAGGRVNQVLAWWESVLGLKK